MSGKEPPKIPPRLVTAIADGKGVLFAGAGLSRARTEQGEGYLPNWKGLLILLLKRATQEGGLNQREAQRLRRQLEAGKFLLVAEIIRRRLGANEVDRALVEIFANPELHSTHRHELITQIPFSGVVTTNYDRLLERAYPDDLVAYTARDSDDVTSALQEGKFFILKSYGDITRRSTIVLSEQEYRNLIHQHRGYLPVLNAIFITKTVLFIGTSLGDPDVRLVLETLSEAFKGRGPTHYALLPENEVSRPEFEHWSDFYGIVPILYDATSGHPEVDRFLENLKDQVLAQVKSKDT